MAQNHRNIYQIARENKGFTQEKSAELMDISVDSLRAYEGGKRIPPTYVVLKMVELYDFQYLAYQHLKISDAVGNKYLPELQIKDLAQSVLAFLDECEDLEKIRKLMVKIAKDNQIDENEKHDWENIIKKINGMVSTGMALIFIK